MLHPLLALLCLFAPSVCTFVNSKIAELARKAAYSDFSTIQRSELILSEAYSQLYTLKDDRARAICDRIKVSCPICIDDDELQREHLEQIQHRNVILAAKRREYDELCEHIRRISGCESAHFRIAAISEICHDILSSHRHTAMQAIREGDYRVVENILADYHKMLEY